MILKAECRNCGGHVEYEPEAGGATVECPHCNQATTLPSAPPVLSAAQPPRSKSLTPCFDCGQWVSKRADTCPHCGAPVRPRKGVFYYVFVGTVSLIMTVIVLVILFSAFGAFLFEVWSRATK